MRACMCGLVGIQVCAAWLVAWLYVSTRPALDCSLVAFLVIKLRLPLTLLKNVSWAALRPRMTAFLQSRVLSRIHVLLRRTLLVSVLARSCPLHGQQLMVWRIPPD